MIVAKLLHEETDPNTQRFPFWSRLEKLLYCPIFQNACKHIGYLKLLALVPEKPEVVRGRVSTRGGLRSTISRRMCAPVKHKQCHWVLMHYTQWQSVRAYRAAEAIRVTFDWQMRPCSSQIKTNNQLTALSNQKYVIFSKYLLQLFH